MYHWFVDGYALSTAHRKKVREQKYSLTDHLRLGGSRTDCFTQDEHGQWWYKTKSQKNRIKAIVKQCEVCKKDFVTHKIRPAKTCSTRKCRRAIMLPSWEKTVFRRGRDHYNWKGGETRNPDGYVYVHMPDHPSLKGTQRKYVRRCRLAMEKKLGRPLFQWEEVHHLNGTKADDSPENLEVWVVSHPAGVRQYCPVCTCSSCTKARVVE